MLRLPSLGELDRGMAARIYLCTSPTDMRKGFDTLAALVQEFLGQDPLSGHLFLFVGRGKDRLKMLYWDGTGVWIFAKRLEKGRLSWPGGSDRKKLSLAPEALTMLIAGIDLKDGCLKAWYER